MTRIIQKIQTIIICLLATITTSTVKAQEPEAKVLVLFYSDNAGTYELAKEIAKGIESEQKVQAVIKQVSASTNPKLKDIPVVTVDDLPTYDGIAFGSPVYFGNISTGMSAFIAKTVDLWSNHALEGMPATVFMSAGSGAGNELAVQAFWNSLAVHGMVLVSNGIRGYESIDKSTPQGNTVLGTTSLASLTVQERPSKSERHLAKVQGENFANVALALKGVRSNKGVKPLIKKENTTNINQMLKQKNIVLPDLPKPVGNYELYTRSGNLVYINQVALKDGKIFNPGKIGLNVNEQQVKEATKITMLNVISILNEAVGGDLNRVKRCVQLTGIFNTTDEYTQHAELMNAASNLTVEIFGDKGKHARGALGVSSLPLNSSVEIQAIFEVE